MCGVNLMGNKVLSTLLFIESFWWRVNKRQRFAETARRQRQQPCFDLSVEVNSGLLLYDGIFLKYATKATKTVVR